MWFPLRLRQVILRSTPAVDRFNELGKLRTASDMDREYQRLIDRDRGPFAFLYKGSSRLPLDQYVVLTKLQGFDEAGALTSPLIS